MSSLVIKKKNKQKKTKQKKKNENITWPLLHMKNRAPLSMGFSRQEYWSGLPFPSPRDLPNPGIRPGSPALQTDSLPTELQGKPSK